MCYTNRSIRIFRRRPFGKIAHTHFRLLISWLSYETTKHEIPITTGNHAKTGSVNVQNLLGNKRKQPDQ